MARSNARLRDARDPSAAASLRRCDHEGCAEPGEFRAPRSRTDLNAYYWFCLEHVRAYNAAWDYYKGMNQTEIEAARRADTVGWRPTWPMGSRNAFGLYSEHLRAAFSRLFEEDMMGGAEAPRAPRPHSPEDEALVIMDLPVGATLDEIKVRYKELVKRHHPDANGGDKEAEERLKLINQAYTILKAQAQNAKLGARD